MEKFARFFVVLLSLFLLVGCNSNKVTNAPDNAPSYQKETDKKESATSEDIKDVPFNFTHFSLEVKYSPSETYEAEYENDSSGVEAEIEDNIHNENLKGNKAYEKLEPLFKSLSFDATTQDSVVATDVLKTFGLDENYKEFKLEVRFVDGNKKEYEIKK
ncbi:YusW family protein [Solibacillus sp. CAU 1738]|uniref:YusW family protein n=1 Tax=Solibacillus sp. CAU 1738 TaxID=3140363 RepID=UPI003260B064